MDYSKQFKSLYLIQHGSRGNCSRTEVMNKEIYLNTISELLRGGEGASHQGALKLVFVVSRTL